MTTDLDRLLDRAYPVDEVGPGDTAAVMRRGRQRHVLVAAATAVSSLIVVGVIGLAVFGAADRPRPPVIEGVGSPTTADSRPDHPEPLPGADRRPGDPSSAEEEARDKAAASAAAAISEASARQQAAIQDGRVTFAEYETAVLSFTDCMAALGDPVSGIRLDERLERYEWFVADGPAGDTPCYGRTLEDVDRLWTIATEERRTARGWGDVDRFRACLVLLGRTLPDGASAGAAAIQLQQAGQSTLDCEVIPPVVGTGAQRAMVELDARDIDVSAFTVAVQDPAMVERVVRQAPAPGTVVGDGIPAEVSLQVGVMPGVKPSLLVEDPSLSEDVAAWMQTIAACMTDAGVPTTFTDDVAVTTDGDATVAVLQDCQDEHRRPDASTRAVTTFGLAWLYDRWLGPVSDCLADLGLDPVPAPTLEQFLVQPFPDLFWNPALSAVPREQGVSPIAIQDDCAVEPPFDLLVRINDGEVTSPSTAGIRVRP